MNIINRNELLLSAAAAIVCELHVASEEFVLALNLFQTMCKRVKKKKKLVRFCQLSPFPDVFGMRNAVGQLKKKLHFQKYLGSKTPVKSQGSESAQKFVSSGVQSLSWMQIPEWEGIEVMECRFFSQIQIRRKPWPDNRLVWEKSLKLF